MVYQIRPQGVCSQMMTVEVEDGKVILKRAGIGKTVTITAMAADGSGKKASVRIRISGE